MEALLIIDMQEAYVSQRQEREDFKEAIEYMNYTSRLFRKSGRPVFIVRDLADGDGPSFETIEAIDQETTDHQIIKYANNSFWQTDLEVKLKELGVDFLVLAGNAAEYCISATYFGALEREFSAVLLQNGVVAETAEGLLASNLTRPLISYQALVQLLK